VSTVHASPRGAIHLAVDIATERPCVLKQARRHGAASPSGLDAWDRLTHEATILQRLATDHRFPTSYGLVEHGGDLFLAMSDMGGTTLTQRVSEDVQRTAFLTTHQVTRWAREVTAILSAVHRAGLVYGDVKPDNIMVNAEGQLGLIDFELTCTVGQSMSPHGRGTRGYMSPQQAAGEPPTVTDDIYAIGALLFWLATNAEPSRSPNPAALLQRPPALLNPAVHPDLVAIMARCLANDPDDRFPTLLALDAALAGLTCAHVCVSPRAGGEVESERDEGAVAHAAAGVRHIADTLGATARESADGSGVYWAIEEVGSPPAHSLDINSGTAGVLLALSEVVAVGADPAHRATLEAGARWLADASGPVGSPIAGLYIGEAGVGAALLRAGQVLNDPALIAKAVERGRFVAAQHFLSPDLFNGTAGRLRFHLMLWDETGDEQALRDAVTAGKTLLAAAEPAGDGELKWRIPAGFDRMSGACYAGYAHGAAGVADALLDLTDATGDERFLHTAQGAARWLRRLAVPFMEDGAALSWPTTEDGPPTAPFWCHGATGIGRFFLHLAAFDGATASNVAARAARAAARGARWAGPTQCHGLAGNADFLLDVYHATADPSHLREARVLERLLYAFETNEDGGAGWSEGAGHLVPGYLLGLAGIAVCLLHLANAEAVPHPPGHRRGVPKTMVADGGGRFDAPARPGLGSIF
jgi:hypothetical protein